jgi:hypothetical protein
MDEVAPAPPSATFLCKGCARRFGGKRGLFVHHGRCQQYQDYILALSRGVEFVPARHESAATAPSKKRQRTATDAGRDPALEGAMSALHREDNAVVPSSDATAAAVDLVRVQRDIATLQRDIATLHRDFISFRAEVVPILHHIVLQDDNSVRLPDGFVMDDGHAVASTALVPGSSAFAGKARRNPGFLPGSTSIPEAIVTV